MWSVDFATSNSLPRRICNLLLSEVLRSLASYSGLIPGIRRERLPHPTRFRVNLPASLVRTLRIPRRRKSAKRKLDSVLWKSMQR